MTMATRLVCAMPGCQNGRNRSQVTATPWCEEHMVQSAPRLYSGCCQQGCTNDTLAGAAYCMEHLAKFQTPEVAADHRLVIWFIRFHQNRGGNDLGDLFLGADDPMFEALIKAIREVREADGDAAN